MPNPGRSTDHLARLNGLPAEGSELSPRRVRGGEVVARGYGRSVRDRPIIKSDHEHRVALRGQWRDRESDAGS